MIKAVNAESPGLFGKSSQVTSSPYRNELALKYGLTGLVIGLVIGVVIALVSGNRQRE